jgi:hypothetical protein
MKRKLRIAFSVLCGIACLLLVALWVRSYYWFDHLSGVAFHGAPTLAMFSVRGSISARLLGPGAAPSWGVGSLNLNGIRARHGGLPQFSPDLGVDIDLNELIITFSYWFLLVGHWSSPPPHGSTGVSASARC